MPDFDPTQPFTTKEGLAAGRTRGQLRGSGFHRPFLGVHVSASEEMTFALRVRALMKVLPDTARASHSTAANLRRIPVPDDPSLNVSVPDRKSRRARPGVEMHVRSGHDRTRTVEGVKVSSATDLFCELGESLGLVDLVVAGDAMVKRGLVTCDALVAAAQGARLRPGLVRRAASLVRERVDSPMETRLRLLIVLAGLPEPTVNRSLTENGRVVYRVDLSYLELRLAIEYDGKHHRADPDQWDDDIDREDWFTRRGWERLPVVARGIYQRPGETLDRICAAIKARGGAVPPLDPEWRRYFPGKA